MLTPEDAEGVLQAGSADYIALCRALVADPHWCLKAFGEVKRPIRHCISCNVCFERLTLELDVACVQNPLVGTEFETLAKLEPGLEGITQQDTRVLVIGGGVAGLEAARVFAANGQQVEVWEREASGRRTDGPRARGAGQGRRRGCVDLSGRGAGSSSTCRSGPASSRPSTADPRLPAGPDRHRDRRDAARRALSRQYRMSR